MFHGSTDETPADDGNKEHWMLLLMMIIVIVIIMIIMVIIIIIITSRVIKIFNQLEQWQLIILAHKMA